FKYAALLRNYCKTLHDRSRFLFFFYNYAHHRHLHSFPTRRSSDLGGLEVQLVRTIPEHVYDGLPNGEFSILESYVRALRGAQRRSEEHTSELQSRENLVCRLLLEKKKKKNTHKYVEKEIHSITSQQ